MSRTLAQILTSYDDAQAAEASLAGLNSPSQTAIYTIWKYICAVCTLFLEQLIDIKKTEIETVVKAAPVGSEPWLQAKVLEFQYDSVTPQFLTLVNFAPVYNPIDITKRIITRSSVNTGTNNKVYVKVAKSDPPVALSAPELSALQAYLTNGGDGTYAGRGVGLGFAGIDYVAISRDADKLYLAGTIYYNGQYAATIQQSVIDAINAYLLALSTSNFNGSISLLGITDAIQSVLGVNDLSLEDVATRPDLTAFANKTYMRQAKTDIITTTPTYAGYIVEETTAGQTFTDKLIFEAS